MVKNFSKLLMVPKKKEKEVYKALRKVWRGFIDRVEPKYKGGIPDLLMVPKAIDRPFFLELKVAELTETGLVKITVRPSQILWFMKYPSTAFLLAYLKGEYYLFQKDKVPALNQSLTAGQFRALAALRTEHLNDICKQLIFFVS